MENKNLPIGTKVFLFLENYTGTTCQISKISLFIICFCCFIGFSVSFCMELSNNSTKKTIDIFLSEEFNGNPSIRVDTVIYSKKKELELTKKDNLHKMKLTYWNTDKLYIVLDYKIESVNYVNSTAEAIVKYTNVGHTNGKGLSRKIVKKKSIEQIKYHLISDNDKWFIIDPPEPRISHTALTSYYKSLIHERGDGWIQRDDISNEQKNIFYKYKEDLAILNNIIE